MLKAFEECSDLAPLHNPANLKGVNAVKELMPGLPQVGVFDTAFHQTMPAKAYMYAIPYELYEKYGVRRYGFHGTSHRYVSARALEFLGMKAEGTKMITCHIGNGGSVAAVVDGKCVDTSMGLTPLEGLVMGTRSGDIDGGAVTFLQKKLGLDADGMSNLLNKKSGVAGITGGSSDMRDVENAAQAGEPKAVLAQEMYFYRIKKYIGAYAAAMGGVEYWLRRCISIASRSISVPMLPLWVALTSSSSLPVLVRTRLACAQRYARVWSSWVSSSTTRRTTFVAKRLSSLLTTLR